MSALMVCDRTGLIKDDNEIFNQNDGIVYRDLLYSL